MPDRDPTEPAPPSDRRRSALALVLLLLVTLALWLPRLHGPIDLRWDGGVYYVLGTSLAEGAGYRLLNEPGRIIDIQYPPALPALIAVEQKVLGTSDPYVAGQALRYTFFAISLLYTVAVFTLARRRLSPGFAFLAALLIVTCIHTFYMAGLLFAEIPFALTALLFLLVVERRGTWQVLAGALAVLSYLLRTAGVVVLATWVLGAVLERRYRAAGARLLVALLPVLAWQWHIASVQRGESYRQPSYAYQRAPYQYYNVSYSENMGLLDPFQPELGPLGMSDLAKRAMRNALLTPYYFGQSLTNSEAGWLAAWSGVTETVFGWPAPEWPIKVVVFLLGLGPMAGLWLLWRSGDHHWLLYVLGTWCMVAMTPWPGQYARYLTPVAPLLAISLVLLVKRSVERPLTIPRRLSALYGLGSIFICLLMNGASMLASFTHRLDGRIPIRWTADSPWLFYGVDWTDLETAAAWLRERAEPDSRVATEASHYFYLLSGFETIMPPMVAEPKRAQELLDDASVRYLVLGAQQSPGFARRYMEPVIEAFPSLWRAIYSIGDGTDVYERTDELMDRDR